MIQTPFLGFFFLYYLFETQRMPGYFRQRHKKCYIPESKRSINLQLLHQSYSFFAVDICVLFSSEVGKLSLKQLLNLTHHGKLRNVRMFYLVKSMISYQEKLEFTPKILHNFPRKQGLAASLGDPCIWLYFQLTGTTASFTTTNAVLPS